MDKRAEKLLILSALIQARHNLFPDQLVAESDRIWCEFDKLEKIKVDFPEVECQDGFCSTVDKNFSLQK